MGSTGMRTVVAMCGVLAIAGACSSGSKQVSADSSSSRADDSTTVSSTRAAKRAATKPAVKAKTAKTAKTATTSGSKNTSGTAATGTSSAGSTAGTAGAVVVPTTAGASGGTSSQFVIGPVGTTTRTTVKPFDATKPIDLSGTPGVTAEEQARAEALLRNTMRDLPRLFPSVAAAKAAGYRSIQDHIPGITADEHYVNWAYLDDGRLLDSRYPESLVYEFPNGTPKLVAAMYIMPIGSRFTDVPNVGGALTQWHVHNNLCLITDPNDADAKVIYSVVQEDQACPGASQKASVPMLHVWIVSNPCGPFAALEGIGAGQVPDGETRLCDTLHGS